MYLLTILNTLYRYILQVVGELASKQGIAEVTDENIVAWANEKVKIMLLIIYTCVQYLLMYNVKNEWTGVQCSQYMEVYSKI